MDFDCLVKYIERENLTNLPYFLIIILFIIISLNLCLNFIKWMKCRKTLPPGPIGLPFLGYLPFLGPDPPKSLWKMKEKYGDIIGIYFGKRYTIVVNDYLIGKEVISNSSALDRPQDLFNYIPFGFGHSNSEEWVEQRKFSISSIRDLGLGRSSWEDQLLEEVTNFVEEIQKSKSNAVDITKALDYSVSSNIISLLIGRKLDKKDEANKVKLSLDFADVAFANAAVSQATNLIPVLRKLFILFNIYGYDTAEKIMKRFIDFIKEEIQKHKISQDLNDFISSYLEKMKALSSRSNIRHYFSEGMLEGNVIVLFLGASDTIRSSLVWLFRLMADHKDIQVKVYQEIMEVMGRDGTVKYEERHKIPYTFAVLMESQRFSSVVPLSSTRQANQDIPVGHYVIPKGADITVNFWGLHNDPKYWKDPEKFMPERFLTDNGTKLIKQPPSYAPFSLGKRNCPGETVAWMEILAYFCNIIQKYEISFPPGVKPEYKILSGLVYRLAPQPLCFKERC